MQNPEDFDVDSLLKQFDDLQDLDAQAVIERRKKLKEQILDKTPQVVLQRLDLKCLIMKVKQSLSEFQRRIDESVTQQQLRRTTRARRPVRRDSEVVSFFKERIDLPSNTDKTIPTQTCKDSICCQHVSEICGLVQVECLPVSASTNLITIFVPSILQEKLHSCKYKISIDLNRLDLTKKILDLNVEQHIHSGLEAAPKPTSSEGIEIQVDQPAGEDDQSCRVTYEFKSNGNGENVVELVNTNAPGANGKSSKTNANPTDCIGCVEHSRPSTSAGADGTISLTGEKKPRQKRKTKSPNKNPPKKRGRKPGSKNKKSEKSEIAKYVETFACLASPSAVSQIVSSTTQPDEGASIAYFMNGAWTLTAPTAEGPCQMVTTTNETVNLDDTTVGGQDTFIPFEDFVNFIENPSIDAGSNVIARVLDGTIDNADCNPQEFHIPQQPEGNQNVNSVQQNSSEKGPETYTTSILSPLSIGHNNSTNNISTMPDQIIAGEVLNLSHKEQSNAKTLGSPCQEKNVVNDPFIFGAGPSMPSLDDDMDGDLFCSPSQQSKQSVVFSTAPRTSPASTHNSSHKSSSKTEEGSLTDSAIEVLDYSKHAPASIKNKTKAEVLQGMSLLEIENDIDDSLLDFDNCLDDDLLSLAPSSCFNTPNDDRFGDSKFLDADKLDSTPPNSVDKINKSLTPAPRSRLEQSLLRMNEEESSPALKNFKIPRVRSSTNETVEDLSPTKPTVTRILPPTDGENKAGASTYRLSPASVPRSIIQISSSSTTSDAVTNDFTEMVSTREISKMFGSLCYGFLADKCFNTNCKFSHRLLELSVIITSLSLFRNEVLHCAYRFIWRHHKLFKFYFPIFCEEYARRNMRNKLSSMINDCIMQPNCLPYLRNIYSVLLGNGLNRVNACRFILNRIKDRSTAVVDILLEIIIEAGASMFNREIDQFSQISSYKFRMTDINGMASACLCSGSAELVTVLIKCLMCVDQTEFMTMRSPELIQVLEMIKNGGFEGL